MKAKDKIVKFISAFLIILIIIPTVLFSSPKQANAQWYTFSISDFWTGLTSVSGKATSVSSSSRLGVAVKTFAIEIYKQTKRAIIKRLIQEMTKSTVNWINTGFHGQPLFLENPQSFFKDIAKSEVKTLVDQFGYDRLKFPFGRAWAKNVISSYKSTLESNASYTLGKVMTPEQAQNYREDFNVGGWSGYLTNTQYPSNNYLGFSMLATETLARKMQGTVNKVNTTLDRGQGFLSPETCADNNGNNEYNKVMANAWNRPSFDQATFDKQHGGDADNDPDPNYDANLAKEKAKWAKKNTCKNLVNTTPGSLVASKIMKSINMPEDQAGYAQMIGDSFSAIFDALLNKFIGDGLTALASKTNPPPPTDNWSYDGQTLGSPIDNGTGTDWDSGPSQPIILSDFKRKMSGYDTGTCSNIKNSVGKSLPEQKDISEAQCKSQSTPGYTIGTCSNLLDYNFNPLPDETNVSKVKCDNEPGTWTQKDSKLVNTNTTNWTKTGSIPGDITNTTKELQLMSDITDYWAQIWPKARDLDLCIPGPDLGWQDRLQGETLRNTKLQKLQAEDDAKKAAEATMVVKELKFATDFFKDWINNKMMTELPSSIFFMEAVDDVKTLSQKSDDLTDAKRLKTQALARLQAIKTVLATITDQPSPGSALEKTLISLKKQYDGVSTVITTSASLSDTQNELDTAKDRFNKLKEMLPKCETERKAAGWGVPGGRTSSYSQKEDEKGKPTNEPPYGAEQALFCDLPIKGGYDHESFCTTGSTWNGTTCSPVVEPAYRNIPMVNAKKVIKYEVMTIKSVLTNPFGGGKQMSYVNIQLSCNNIFNAKLLDYKGNLPGLTKVVENYVPLPDDGGDDGGTVLPADIATKHGDHKAEVEAAKQVVISSGKTFSTSSSACDKFEITKKAAFAINQAGGTGTGAGLLSNPGGDNCVVGTEKYAPDAIAFPDGYLYQILDPEAADGNGPIWAPASCGTADGTCADLYRPAISP